MPDSEFWLGLGGFVFNVKARYYNTKYFCRNYLLQKSPDTTADSVISVTQEEIEAEKTVSTEDWIRDESLPAETIGSYLELSRVFRHIGDFLSFRNACVFHGVLLELDGEGYIFTTKSGTGKTTQAMNWLKAFPQARIINGDKPVLQVEGNRLMGYGTPWCGKERLQVNERIPVKAVIIIERGKDNSIEPVTDIQMLPVWLTQTHRPNDAMAMERMMDTAIRMMSLVSLFRLRCNMDMESALVAKAGIDNASSTIKNCPLQ